MAAVIAPSTSSAAAAAPAARPQPMLMLTASTMVKASTHSTVAAR